MKGNVLVAAALAVFFSALGCVMWPSATSTVSSAEAEKSPTTGIVRTTAMPYVGVAMQLQEPWRMSEYMTSLDQIAGLGADTVSLVVAARQDTAASSHVFIDMRNSPSPEQLKAIISHAKSRKLRVILMPIVLLVDPGEHDWRGTIHAEDWNKWWDSYREMIEHYAAIAQESGVDVLVIGSELVSTERFGDQWTKTIHMIRHDFSGALTYSSNWDHYTSVPFWDELDMIGMNSYWKLGENRKVTVDQIVGRWREIQTDLFKFEHKTGKPLILLEAGWCSLTNAADEPWNYVPDSPALDLDLQRKLYEGFFSAWWDLPELGGFIIWEWPPGAGGADDLGYTPKGKPAERTMKQWFTKPRWTVRP
jgi:hypothetical protein